MTDLHRKVQEAQMDSFQHHLNIIKSILESFEYYFRKDSYALGVVFDMNFRHEEQTKNFNELKKIMEEEQEEE
jgi:hypothetical protein